MLKTDEHFEPLGNGIEVIVSKIHRFGTDTVLLADFSKPKDGKMRVNLAAAAAQYPSYGVGKSRQST